MNIQTVADNLRNTIAGKEALLEEYNRTGAGEYHKLVLYTMQVMLKTNIRELETILADVEQCLPDNFANMRNSG